VPTGAVANEADVVGQTTLTAIPAGAAVVRAQLVAANGRTGASVSLEKGKVLVAFPTVDPLTLAGLVRQGDRVDVLATVTSGSGETARKTQTTLQNLEVVDVLTSGAGAQKTMSLTFVVDHQVALVLKYLRDTQATIDIAVRSRAETDPAATVSVDLAYLLQTYGVKR
jgi:pilus assembly protein CpaB